MEPAGTERTLALARNAIISMVRLYQGRYTSWCKQHGRLDFELLKLLSPVLPYLLFTHLIYPSHLSRPEALVSLLSLLVPHFCTTTIYDFVLVITTYPPRICVVASRVANTDPISRQ